MRFVIHFLVLLSLSSCSIFTNDFSLEPTKAFSFEREFVLAEKRGKPLLIYFSGFACMNCKRMDTLIMKSSKIKRLISKKYTLVVLNVDDKSQLEQKYWRIKEEGNDKGKILKSAGEVNVQLQTKLTGCCSQPRFSVIKNPYGENESFGYTMDEVKLVQFLE